MGVLAYKYTIIFHYYDIHPDRAIVDEVSNRVYRHTHRYDFARALAE